MNEDSLLAEAICSGAVDRFEELVERYKDRIYAMAYRFTRSHPEAQDLAQEIFLKLHRHLHTFQGQSTLSTWIYRVALNRSLDWQRKHKRHQGQLQEHHRCQEDETDPIERLPSTADGPETEYLRQEEHRELHEALQSLPEKYRVVIHLFHFEQLSYPEIGEILKLPARTVETRLYRGRQKLKQLLTGTKRKDVTLHEVVGS